MKVFSYLCGKYNNNNRETAQKTEKTDNKTHLNCIFLIFMSIFALIA